MPVTKQNVTIEQDDDDVARIYATIERGEHTLIVSGPLYLLHELIETFSVKKQGDKPDPGWSFPELAEHRMGS